MHYSQLRALLVWFVAVPWLAGAQGASPAERGAERELVFSGAPGEPPLLLHGVPDVTITLILHASIKREEMRSPPGVDVRPHPFRQDGLLVTPAPTFAALGAVAFAVPLSNGAVLNFAMALAHGMGDMLVRVRRLPEREALVRREEELRAALAHAVDAAAGLGTACTLVPVEKVKKRYRNPHANACRRVGELVYIRIRATCSGTVSLSGAPQAGASIVFEETNCPPDIGCTTRLVLRKAAERTGAVTVALRGRDGSLCESVDLQGW